MPMHPDLLRQHIVSEKSELSVDLAILPSRLSADKENNCKSSHLIKPKGGLLLKKRAQQHKKAEQKMVESRISVVISFNDRTAAGLFCCHVLRFPIHLQ